MARPTDTQKIHEESFRYTTRRKRQLRRDNVRGAVAVVVLAALRIIGELAGNF